MVRASSGTCPTPVSTMKRLGFTWWRRGALSRDLRVDGTPGRDGWETLVVRSPRRAVFAGGLQRGPSREKLLASESMLVLTDVSVDSLICMMLLGGVIMVWLWWLSTEILNMWRDREGQPEPRPDVWP